MWLKVNLFFMITALLAQVITSQFIGNSLNQGFPNQAQKFNSPFGPNFGANAPGPSSTGGRFSVTSSSPFAPTGVSVLAENLAIEGGLSVGGQLPFLGSVGVEGILPGFGSGAVSYGCGNGNLGITSEGLSPGGPVPYGLAGQNFGPNAPGLYGPNPGSFGPGPNQGFGPGFGPNGPSFGPNGPSFGPNLGPSVSAFGSGIGFNGPL